jgi:hypothetical protein
MERQQMARLNATFSTLLKEAEFTKEMLGSGATQIRKANYASKGIYFQAFTSLSTGLERIGKLCIMLDRYIETRGAFPDFNYMKNEIGHKLLLLYNRSQEVIERRTISLNHLQAFDDTIHQAIIEILHNYAEGDRYSNINILVRGRQINDPIAEWFNRVDVPLFKSRVSRRKREIIEQNAEVTGAVMDNISYVLHLSETGAEISNAREASRQAGIYESTSPYRQLYVLQVIRYWTELLLSLEELAREVPGENIPFFREIFFDFGHDDSYFRTRKKW